MSQFNPNSGPVKPSDTTEFLGYVTEPQATSGVQQNSEWKSPVPVSPVGNVPTWGVIQGVPAASRVTVSGTGLVKVGPSQYTLRIVLGQSATLVGGLTDAQNNVVTPVAPTAFVYGSRQRLVATIDAQSGVITTHSIGGVELTIRYPKGQVNSAFDGATPVLTAGFIEGVVQLTVTQS